MFMSRGFILTKTFIFFNNMSETKLGLTVLQIIHEMIIFIIIKYVSFNVIMVGVMTNIFPQLFRCAVEMLKTIQTFVRGIPFSACLVTFLSNISNDTG